MDGLKTILDVATRGVAAAIAAAWRAGLSVVPDGPGAYDGGMNSVELPGSEVIRQLVDEYRGRCLWFLRADYYPETKEEVLRVLASIQRHGDVDAFRRAGELKRWVLATSNAPSVASSQKTASEPARATWTP